MEKTLHALGITRRYKGYRQLLYALTLGSKPTMQIYQETAEHFGCSWRAVEQNIRTAAAHAWEMNPSLLSEMAGCPLDSAPTTGRFIKIIAAHD